MMSVSVDGYMEGPKREIDWHMVDDELHQHMNGWLAGAGGFLEGRVTYELMEEFWPTADHDPAALARHMAGPLVDIHCQLGLADGDGVVMGVDLGYGYIDENRTTS